MKRLLLGLICKWRGHRWGKAYNFDGEHFAQKACRVCGIVRAVKRRVK